MAFLVRRVVPSIHARNARGQRNEPRENPSRSGPLGGHPGATSLGSGLLAAALALVFFYSALSLGQVSVVKPIAFAVAPVTAVFFGALLLGEPLTVRKMVAIALIAAGIVLMAVPGKARSEGPMVVEGSR